ncbi:MAG: TonB-dependent receptor [Deltaproteobacteria bacterium]|nr:TonB-dependent receptor [Deltaproteobacteria bacterium]
MLALCLLLGLLVPCAALAEGTDAPTPALDEPLPILQEPVLLDFVQAPYPPEALAMGMEGTVHLAIEVDADGAVVSVEVIAPAGHGFDEAALEAARSFRFSPALDASGPVPVIVEFAYGFVLDSASRPGARPEAQEVPEADAPVNLEIRLREMGTRRPLAGFQVEGEGFTGLTDDEGWARFQGVPPGTWTLRAARGGFDPVERSVEILANQVTTLDLWVRNPSYRDDEIVGVYQRRQEEVTRRTLTVEQVRRVPGTFGDPIRVIQSLPGAARSPFSTGMLVIRGANPEDSAVYVDGVRIPFIYHLDGMLSVVNADLVESVDYLPGGYGVRYGRSMGGVVDVRTQHTFPEDHVAHWTTDILHSGGLVEGRAGPGDRWGYAIGARRSYIDVFIPLFTKGSGYVVQPRWYDYQVKVERLELAHGRFSFFLFGFRDRIDVSTPDDVAQGPDRDAQGDLGAIYGTHRLAVSWQRDLSDDWALEIVPSLGVDLADGSVSGSMDGRETQWLLELRAEAPWTPSDHLTVRPGLDFIGGRYDFEVGLPFDPSMMGDYDPLGEREPYALSDSGWVWGPGVFLEADVRPLADPDRLRLTPGLRMDDVRITGGFHDLAWEPRLGLGFRPVPRTLLKASAGLYHQPPLPMEMYRPDGEVDLVHERAVSATVGVEQEVGQAFRVEVEGFHKTLDDLIVFAREMTSMDDPYFFNAGVGRVYGAEVMLRRDPVGPLYGWLSYTLSRSERRDWPSEDWYPFEFDQTHILVAVGGWRLPRDFELSTRIQYVTGNPTTPYAGGVYDVDQAYYWSYSTAPRNSERLPDYFAVDLKVEKLLTFRTWQLALYVDLLNVVRGVNPEFVIYNYDYTESAYVRGLPFIPNPGFSAKVHF